MTRLLRAFSALFILSFVALSLAACAGIKPGNAKANQPIPQDVQHKLASIGSSPGAPMLIRIFKQSSELEVWKQGSGGTFKLVKTYEICAWSGNLGPKIKEGDRQAPEGFYTITPGLMNPNSNYYLAFNTGFPNKFDRAWGRTGADLMVHGDCSSRGCYSMTDASIAEIYAMARETFKGGNPSFQLQIFPFRMTVANLAKHADSPNMAFWKDIKEGYDRFELSRTPPTWDVCNKQYAFGMPRETTLEPTAACPSDAASWVSASLKAKMAADDAAIATQVAALQDKAAQAAADAEKAARAEAEAKARGEAIGNFIGGLFGGDKPEDTKPSGKPIDPSKVAPIPAPRLNRA